MAALEEVVRVRQELDHIRHRQAALEDIVHGALAELRASVAEIGGDVQESRALSLRVGQLTDLVFARLADASTTSV
jgi:hypothetical protein